ncbi:MAG: hypothetical protein O3C67_04025 [Cyanobacteria bacterium]|nr:hypothetical protein [Cyanobacteriota bacterium]MEB3268572.1 hypothetical protein [Leptolyngbya sp.]
MTAIAAGASLTIQWVLTLLTKTVGQRGCTQSPTPGQRHSYP